MTSSQHTNIMSKKTLSSTTISPETILNNALFTIAVFDNFSLVLSVPQTKY